MGYLFFFLTLLFYVGLAMFTATKPNLSGDSGMGYGLGMAFLGLGFAVSGLALTINLLANSRLNWLGFEGGARTGLALLAWLFVVMTTFFCAAFKWEWPNDNNPYPQFLHWLAVGHGQIWVPLLWLGACLLSLNGTLQAQVAPSLPKLTFYSSLLVSGLYSAGLAFGYLVDSAQRTQTVLAENQARDDYWHQQVLDDIANHKPTDPLVNLLSQTTQVRPEDSRAAAVAKVKSHPDWEAELIRLLQSEQGYRQVYYFLDGNAVDHPAKFAEPLNQSILRLADAVKNEVKTSNNLQSWTFESFQIDNLMRSLDGPILNQGVDFRPNVIRVQQALQTTLPEQSKDVRFDAAGSVEDWLRKHRK